MIIIGSQAILATWPDAPLLLRRSGEIDAYPANARDWEVRHPGFEASEEIHALFGEASPFHLAHGFYIDGVDETTALLPADWRQREVRRPIQDGEKTIFAVVPEVHDLAVSKLCRLEDKDKEFVGELATSGRLNISLLLERLRHVELAEAARQRVEAFVRGLTA